MKQNVIFLVTTEKKPVKRKNAIWKPNLPPQKTAYNVIGMYILEYITTKKETSNSLNMCAPQRLYLFCGGIKSMITRDCVVAGCHLALSKNTITLIVKCAAGARVALLSYRPHKNKHQTALNSRPGCLQAKAKPTRWWQPCWQVCVPSPGRTLQSRMKTLSGMHPPRFYLVFKQTPVGDEKTKTKNPPN